MSSANIDAESESHSSTLWEISTKILVIIVFLPGVLHE